MEEEMFLKILQIVEDVTGVGAEDIRTSYIEECTDARHILVYIMSERGFTDRKITEFTGLTKQAVGNIKRNFQNRRKNYFVNAEYEKIHDIVFG